MNENDKILFDLIEKSKNSKEINEVFLPKNFILTDNDNNIFRPYSVAIGFRELSFSCDNFVLCYVIDTIGFNDYMNLVEIYE